MEHGLNGWVVKTGDSEAVAQILLDIYEGKAKVDRPLSAKREYKGQSDPNAVAQAFVGSYDAAVTKIHSDVGATSEDFWTVGNAARWMLLFSRLLGLPAEGAGLKGDDVETLKSMEIGTVLKGKGMDGENVWKMVMGKDSLEGEGAII